MESLKERRDHQCPPKQPLTGNTTVRIRHISRQKSESSMMFTCTRSHLAGLLRYPRMCQRCQTCQSTFSGAHTMNIHLFSVLNAAGDGGMGIIEMLGSARRSGCGSDSVVENLERQHRYCQDIGKTLSLSPFAPSPPLYTASAGDRCLLEDEHTFVADQVHASAMLASTHGVVLHSRTAANVAEDDDLDARLEYFCLGIVRGDIIGTGTSRMWRCCLWPRSS